VNLPVPTGTVYEVKQMPLNERIMRAWNRSDSIKHNRESASSFLRGILSQYGHGFPCR
jgi:hypothetical protein